MYTEQDLTKIVNAYRKEQQPSPLHMPSDIKNYPNDVLLSYLLSNVSMDKNHVRDLFLQPLVLERWLSLPLQKDAELPELPEGLDYTSPPAFVAQALRVHTAYYAESFGDELIVALPVPKLYTYPSGEKFEYSLLKREQSANMSVFLDGFCVTPSALYVRSQSLKVMRALKKALADDPALEPYTAYLHDFDCMLPGLVLAHEYCELQFMKSGEIPEDPLERELKAERHAKEFLKEQRVPLAHFELRHVLRASKDNIVSRTIVENNFEP
ncbi:MAG: hypothetical protein V1725_05140 [archaeon]